MTKAQLVDYAAKEFDLELTMSMTKDKMIESLRRV